MLSPWKRGSRSKKTPTDLTDCSGARQLYPLCTPTLTLWKESGRAHPRPWPPLGTRGFAEALDCREMVVRASLQPNAHPCQCSGNELTSRAMGNLLGIQGLKYGDAMSSAYSMDTRPSRPLLRLGHTTGVTQQDKGLHQLQEQRALGPTR
jgi:hypothetical protein